VSETVANGCIFQRGNFTLASGAKSSWKIECDALTAADWDGLAVMLVAFLPGPFGRVIGVPRGGVPFADALGEYATGDDLPILVVDDVWTTGGSMSRFITNELGYIWPSDDFFSAVAFARNPVPDGVTALFSMPGNISSPEAGR
jgi:orotate phosphoribosyltransferase